MPHMEQPFEFIFIDHGEKDHDYRDTEENEELTVLMLMNVIAAQREEDRPSQPPDGAHYQEFLRGKMSEAEDLTQEILRRTGNQEQKENEKGTFVMKEEVVLVHRLFLHELVHKRPAEYPRKKKSNQRPYRKADRGQHGPEYRTVEIPANEPCHFAGDGRGHHLENLEKDKTDPPDRAQ